MYCDFHTHDPSVKPGCLKLVSSPAPVRGDGIFWSLELHPWHLEPVFAGLPEEFLRHAEEADALGEAGLDRLKGPDMAVQRQYLHALLALASDLGKPVVFHVVRAFPELLKEVRPYGKVRKLLHGVRCNEEQRSLLRQAGFLLSGSRDSRLDGLETDDETCSIEEIYARYGVHPCAFYEENFHAFLQQQL